MSFSEEERFSPASVEAQDAAFCRAMRKAIRSRAESPPIGIDRRPSTDCPRVIAPPLRMVGGSWIELDLDIAEGQRRRVLHVKPR